MVRIASLLKVLSLLCIAVVVLVIKTTLQKYYTPESYVSRVESSYKRSVNSNLKGGEKATDKDDDTNRLELIHRNRVHDVNKACSETETFRNQTYRGKHPQQYFISTNYNFSYCKVPKTGSTFWIQLFAVLRFGISEGKLFFQKSRNSVHVSQTNFVIPYEEVVASHIRTILVSRDPYSRLFSAYIDKIYVPLMFAKRYTILGIEREENSRSQLPCPANVTFEQVLEWVVADGKMGRTMDPHWAPINSLCRPCDVNSFILAKKETFSQDVEFVLSQVGVEKDKQDFILSVLHERRVEFSLPGIIKTLYGKFSQTARQCFTYTELARRIWKSFQVQGHIQESIFFPEEKFVSENRTANSTYFTDIVLDTIREHPLTPLQAKLQRQRFLYSAYRNIKPETISELQELYKQDFKLFGYSPETPNEYVV